MDIKIFLDDKFEKSYTIIFRKKHRVRVILNWKFILFFKSLKIKPENDCTKKSNFIINYF